MAGKPWSEERKAAARAKREAAQGARKAAPPKAANKPDDNRLAVETAINTLSVPVMYMGRVNESFLADALTMQFAAAPVADAVAQVARINPWLDSALSKGAPATPYILLATTLLSVGAQFAVNHSVKIGPLANSTTPRAQMVAEMKRRMAEQEAAMAAQQAVYDDELTFAQAEQQRQAEAEADEESRLAQARYDAMSGADLQHAYEDTLAM
jgi:hypothetical protein